MAKELSPKRVSLSLAYVTAIVSIVCALLLTIAPKLTMNVFGSIFHGADISKIAVAVTLPNAVLGTIVAAVIALIIGWLFAVIYNKVK